MTIAKSRIRIGHIERMVIILLFNTPFFPSSTITKAIYGFMVNINSGNGIKVDKSNVKRRFYVYKSIYRAVDKLIKLGIIEIISEDKKNGRFFRLSEKGKKLAEIYNTELKTGKTFRGITEFYYYQDTLNVESLNGDSLNVEH